MKHLTLSSLRPGQRGVVAMIQGEGALFQRLIDMGLTPGVTVELVKYAPLGDPLQIRLRGYELSLRRQDARRILLASIQGGKRRWSK